ncbi:signal recognition particle-docking protein FtsY [Halorubraceae archaeon YAN]|nr:signal recognition particle-docking protein FtsY [Halorubraceae archaeon YAN]
MFDGLKDKLNKFRKNVEETAEEKSEAEVEAGSETESEPKTEPALEPEADEPVDATAEPATETGKTGSGSEPEPEPELEPEPASEPELEPEPASEPELEPEPASEPTQTDAESGDSEDSSGPSAFKRAAAFATGKIIIEEEDLEDPLWELEMALIQSDVEMSVAEEMLETIREKMIGETRKQVDTTGELVEEALKDALLDVISVGQFDFDQRIADADKPVTIVFTGVNGVGKTTSIAKLSEYLGNQGYSVVLANGDTYRAGANEQIKSHADNLGRKLISHEQGGDPAAVLYDGVKYAESNDIDIVLGDTAGRLHTSDDLMSQLAKIDRVVDPDMTLFVDEAVAGQDAVQRAKKFNEAAAIDGAVLTKADADSSGGAAISIAYVTGKPILFLGVGQDYNDIERFDPELLVERLLGDE